MKRLKDGLLAAFLAAGTIVLLQASYVLIQVRATMDQIASEIHYQNMALIATEGRIGRAADRTANAFELTASTVRGLRLQLMDKEEGLLGYDIPGFLRAIHRQLDYSTSVLTVAATDFHRAVDGFDNVTSQTAQIESLIFNRLDELTDCEAVGASCLQNRIFNTTAAMQRFSESGARAMDQVEIATPKFLEITQRNGENVAGITADIHTLTARWAAPKTKWGMVKETVSLTLLGCRILC